MGQRHWQPRLRMAGTVVVLLSFLSAGRLRAQEAVYPSVSADELVRLTVHNEVEASDRSSTKYMFCSHKQTLKERLTHLYVETDQAMAGMLISKNGQSLTPQQEQAEINRLYWLSGNPEALRKKHAREQEDSDHTERIVKALPDAFRYRYDGTMTGTAEIGGEGEQLVRLQFSPNPSYSPPSHVEQVLQGMEGFLLIDAKQHRIARIDGTLFKDVSFGWGIIGRLDKGGHFVVQQADVGAGTWELTEMNLHITGKILLFKSLNYESKEVFDDFHRVPDNTTFAQGVTLLKTEQEKLAQGGLPGLKEKIAP